MPIPLPRSPRPRGTALPTLTGGGRGCPPPSPPACSGYPTARLGALPALPASPAFRAQEAPLAAGRRGPGGGRRVCLCPASSSESQDRRVWSAGPAAWGPRREADVTGSRCPCSRPVPCDHVRLSAGPSPLPRARHPRPGASCRPGPAGHRGAWVLPCLQLGDTRSLPAGDDGVRRRMLGACPGEDRVRAQPDPSPWQEKWPLCRGVRPGARDALPSRGLHRRGASRERPAWGLRALNPGPSRHLEPQGSASRRLGVRARALGPAREPTAEPEPEKAPGAGPPWLRSLPLCLSGALVRGSPQGQENPRTEDVATARLGEGLPGESRGPLPAPTVGSRPGRLRGALRPTGPHPG